MKIENEAAFKRDLALTLWNRVYAEKDVTQDYLGRVADVVDSVVARNRDAPPDHPAPRTDVSGTVDGLELPNSQYPLEEWVDGRWHTLVQGRDFTCRTYSMASYCYGIARKVTGLKAETRMDSGEVRIRFTRDPDSDTGEGDG